VLKDPGLQIILPSDSLSLPWLQRAGVSLGCGCEKTILQALFFVFGTCSCEIQTSPALQKNIFSGSDKSGFAKKTNSKKLIFRHGSCETQTSPALQTKTIFQALKNCFSGTALVKLRQVRLCKKKMSGFKKLFFHMFLVKSANSTSLPRFSSLQIAQMHTIHN